MQSLCQNKFNGSGRIKRELNEKKIFLTSGNPNIAIKSNSRDEFMIGYSGYGQAKIPDIILAKLVAKSKSRLILYPTKELLLMCIEESQCVNFEEIK